MMLALHHPLSTSGLVVSNGTQAIAARCIVEYKTQRALCTSNVLVGFLIRLTKPETLNPKPPQNPKANHAGGPGTAQASVWFVPGVEFRAGYIGFRECKD